MLRKPHQMLTSPEKSMKSFLIVTNKKIKAII